MLRQDSGSTQSVCESLEPNDSKSHEIHLLIPYGHPVSTPMIDRTLLKDRRLGLLSNGSLFMRIKTGGAAWLP